MLSISPGLLSMSFCCFQILMSVLWIIIIVPRVAPIVQTLWGHSTAPAKLNISGMELNVKVCFLFLYLALWECHFMEFPLKRCNRPVPSSRTSEIWCQNYGLRTRLSAKSPSSVYRTKSRT